MTTVGELLDDILYGWLYPPDERPVTAYLSGAITSSALTATYDDAPLTAEEEDLITAGGVDIEIGREIIPLGDASNPVGNTLSFIKRGARGTSAASHPDGAEVRVQPTWTRHQAWKAVSRVIQRLYPRLEARRYATVTTGTYYATVPAAVQDPETFVYQEAGGNVRNLSARLLELPGTGTGKVVQIADSSGALATAGLSGSLIYRGRFSPPTRESDDLADLGVTSDLEDVVTVGAVAHIVSGRDLDPLTADFLSERIEGEGGTLRPGAVRESMLRYFEYLLREAQRDQEAPIVMNGWTT